MIIDSEPTSSSAGFPDEFQWGVASAAYQVEGAVGEGGRSASIWDTFSHMPGKTHNGDNADVTVDHFHRYREDVALMREIGVNSYRFSISWSRLIPNGTGQVNQDGVRFYRSLCEELRSVGITPMATLYHWDLPQSLQDRGGWLNPESADWFSEYARIAKDHLGDLVSNWTTLNEPWCVAFLGHSAGEHAPGTTDAPSSFVAAHHLMVAHHRAIAALRSTRPQPDDRVGIVLNLIPAWPVTKSPQDVAAADAIDAVMNRLFADAVFHGRYPDRVHQMFADHSVEGQIDESRLTSFQQDIDFLGVNYYNVNRVRHVPGAPAPGGWPGADEAEITRPPGMLTDMGWGVDPEGLTWTLERTYREWGPIPLIVTENGAAYPDTVVNGSVPDPDRLAYIKSHINAVHEAINRGVDVRGYFVWSLLDNFEWARGFSKRFGIVHVDYNTLQRTIKDSGLWYQSFLNGGR